MITNKRIALVTLAALALAVPSLGKHAVERQVTLFATAQWIINLGDGSSTTVQTGTASHMGRFTLTGAAVWDLSTMTITSGSGVTTAANGDQISWAMGVGPDQVTITGGTGRFEGATGGLNTTWQSDPVITFPDPETMTMELTYTAAGTITY